MSGNADDINAATILQTSSMLSPTGDSTAPISPVGANVQSDVSTTTSTPTDDNIEDAGDDAALLDTDDVPEPVGLPDPVTVNSRTGTFPSVADLYISHLNTGPQSYTGGTWSGSNDDIIDITPSNLDQAANILHAGGSRLPSHVTFNKPNRTPTKYYDVDDGYNDHDDNIEDMLGAVHDKVDIMFDYLKSIDTVVQEDQQNIGHTADTVDELSAGLHAIRRDITRLKDIIEPAFLKQNAAIISLYKMSSTQGKALSLILTNILQTQTIKDYNQVAAITKMIGEL
jgi:hypothetical protein